MSGHRDSHVDALAEYIAESGWVRFQEMNRVLESRGVNIATGDVELMGEHVGQPHVWPGTTLLGPTSGEYVAIVEELFKSFPVWLVLGDMAEFRGGEEPWWVEWRGPRGSLNGNIVASARPPVNPDVDHIADSAKHAFATGTELLAKTQYRLAELAGEGQLDRHESIRLQENLFHIWEGLYAGTLCAVRDWRTPDSTWDKADNTYSDGRQVINQVRIEPREDPDDCWEHNRFMLGDGAPNEFPLGAVSDIAPIRAEDPAGPRETSRASETSDDGTSLAERLRKYL